MAGHGTRYRTAPAAQAEYRHLLGNTPEDREAFFRDVDQDTPNPFLVKLDELQPCPEGEKWVQNKEAGTFERVRREWLATPEDDRGDFFEAWTLQKESYRLKRDSTSVPRQMASCTSTSVWE